jgi:hypothetical protein
MEFSLILQGKRFAGICIYLRLIRRKAPITPDIAVITINPGVEVGDVVSGSVVTDVDGRVVTGTVVTGTVVIGTEVAVPVGSVVAAVVGSGGVGMVVGVVGVISGLKFWRSIVTVLLSAP